VGGCGPEENGITVEIETERAPVKEKEEQGRKGPPIDAHCDVGKFITG